MSKKATVTEYGELNTFLMWTYPILITGLFVLSPDSTSELFIPRSPAPSVPQSRRAVLS